MPIRRYQNWCNRNLDFQPRPEDIQNLVGKRRSRLHYHNVERHRPIVDKHDLYNQMGFVHKRLGYRFRAISKTKAKKHLLLS